MPRYFFFSFFFLFFLLLFGPIDLHLSLNQFALGSVPCSPRSFDSYKATWLMRGCWLPEGIREKTGSISVLDITRIPCQRGYCHGGGGENKLEMEGHSTLLARKYNISLYFFKGWVIPASPNLALQLIVLAKEDGEDGKAYLRIHVSISSYRRKPKVCFAGMSCYLSGFFGDPPRPKSSEVRCSWVLKLVQHRYMAWWPRALGEDISFLTAPTRLEDSLYEVIWDPVLRRSQSCEWLSRQDSNF